MSHQTSLAQFRLGDWTVDLVRRRAVMAGHEVALAPRQARLLETLAAAAPDYLGRNELVATVWNAQSLSDQALHNAISKLRNGFKDDAGNPWLIQTERNRGYRLMVEPVPLAPDNTSRGLQSLTNWPVRHPVPAAVVVMLILVGAVMLGRHTAVEPLARLLESGNWEVEIEASPPHTSR